MTDISVEDIPDRYPTSRFQRYITTITERKDVDRTTAVLVQHLNCIGWMTINIERAKYRHERRNDQPKDEWTIEEVTLSRDYKQAVESSMRLVEHLQEERKEKK